MSEYKILLLFYLIDNYWKIELTNIMASTLAKKTIRHAILVSECNNLFLQLPSNEYLFHDLGLKIVITDSTESFKDGLHQKKSVRINGLSSDPIDYWDETKLERMYSKLVYLLMRLNEMKFSK